MNHHLIVCGLNYHSAPIAIRERFTIPDSCVKHALGGLARFPHLIESAILSTCNRTEVYAVVSDVAAGMKEIESFFLSAQTVSDHGSLAPNFKLLRDDVALHLMRVAGGLDSMVLGEGQIMAQVKEAHRAAQEAGTAGPVLDQLFMLALACGKRIRTETTLGRRAVSVSSAAVELGRELAPAAKGRSATVIGAGKMAKICLKYLAAEKNSAPVKVFNRSLEKLRAVSAGDNLTEKLRPVFDFDARHESAATSRLTIVATSAPTFLLTYDEFAAARKKALKDGTAKKECVIIDISVPRNVDPRIAELEGVTLRHADDLASIVSNNLNEREALVGEAEVIVFETLDEFHMWQHSRIVVPTIAGLREKIEAIRLEHMAARGADSSNQASGCPHKQDIESVSRAIVNQILHHPTVQLKATRDYQVLKQQAEALRTLFNLDPLEDKNSSASQKNRRREKTPAGR